MEQTCISLKAALHTRPNGFNRAVTITLRNRIGSFANTRKSIAIHLQGSMRKELMNLKCLRMTWGSRHPVLLPSHMLQVTTCPVYGNILQRLLLQHLQGLKNYQRSSTTLASSLALQAKRSLMCCAFAFLLYVNCKF